MAGASNLDLVSTRQQRIAELAKQSPHMGFTSLNHHIDLWWLHEAFLRTRRDGAPGVDGQTAAAYEADLRGNLQSLLDRAKSGTYRAPPVRRVHIPKGTGTETRPIGIPTFEDKVLQRSVVMVLEAIYEQDFLGFTHRWGTSRKGNAVVVRQTSASRFSRAVKKIAEWCRKHRHQLIPEQHATLSQKLRGHDGYYGITGNSRALNNLLYVVTRIWRKWLGRRSGAGCLSWERFKRLGECFALPPPRVVHSVCRQTAKL
jgi:hypothetical protein